MLEIEAKEMDFRVLGRLLRETEEDAVIRGCLGQRFIAAGMKPRRVQIHGVPGNALGAYLDGAEIEVFGNAQDAVGDTMNAGSIVIHGNIGDAAGYAMRGGEILVQGSAGYRAGVHMKQYQDKLPAMVIGGRAGSFLGEYQAGGVIVVLGLHTAGPIVGNYPCTGMHGGRLFLRSDCRDVLFPDQVTARRALPEELAEIGGLLRRWCARFGGTAEELLAAPFTVVTPNSENPYTRMYAAN